jgi:hypothetical protein
MRMLRRMCAPAKQLCRGAEQYTAALPAREMLTTLVRGENLYYLKNTKRFRDQAIRRPFRPSFALPQTAPHEKTAWSKQPRESTHAQHHLSLLHPRDFCTQLLTRKPPLLPRHPFCSPSRLHPRDRIRVRYPCRRAGEPLNQESGIREGSSDGELDKEDSVHLSPV